MLYNLTPSYLTLLLLNMSWVNRKTINVLFCPYCFTYCERDFWYKDAESTV